MSARYGLVATQILLAPFGTISGNFSMGRTNPQTAKICLFSLVGQWALFTRFRPLLQSTRGGEVGKTYSRIDWSEAFPNHGQTVLDFHVSRKFARPLPRVNRAHWPTKKNMQKNTILGFVRSMKKLPKIAPNGAGKVFCQPIQPLPTFWTEQLGIVRWQAEK